MPRLEVLIELLNREFYGSPTTTIQTLQNFASTLPQPFSLKWSYLVGGEEGALVEMADIQDDTKSYQLEILAPEHYFSISIIAYGNYPLKVTYPSLDSTLETILSTFKFIQKTPAQ